MPGTLQGFLMVVGMLLFIGSFFTGHIKVKGVEVTAPERRTVIGLRVFGIALMFISGAIFVAAVIDVLDPSGLTMTPARDDPVANVLKK